MKNNNINSLFFYEIDILNIRINDSIKNRFYIADKFRMLSKGVRALRGYFGHPMRPKNENCFSQVSSY